MSPDKIPLLKVKDQLVSGEIFDLIYDEEYELLSTEPKPALEAIGRYYESENYISHTDSRKSLFDKAYQFVKQLMLKRKLKYLDRFVSGSGKLLDYGCGTGDFLKAAKEGGWKIDGIESNPKAREMASDKTGIQILDPESISKFQSKRFNIISLWHVLEHIHDPGKLIKELNDLLEDDGRLIIAVPNFKSFDASYYKAHWAAYDVPRHLWHFSKRSVELLAGKYGLEVDQVLPLKFDAYYVSLLSEKYKSGWMNPFNAFFVASRSNLKAARSGEYSSLIYVLKKG